MLRATICGRVQGVGFRLFVLREAADRGITGYVRNMERGDAVEVVACGQAAAVDRFVRALRVGPPGTRVDTVALDNVENATPYTEFTVRY
ncbi:MAG: acylphosphatase [Dehalococcoidia bacterium]|nr:acylphosphatase [Dehalococcoidia bacterium]